MRERAFAGRRWRHIMKGQMQESSMPQLTPLDRRSGVPLHFQIQQRLMSQIRSGAFSPNHPIPPVQEIASRLGVSQMTARQAIKALCDLGVIYTRQGKGTFVSGIKHERDFRQVHSFTEEMKGRGSVPSSKVLSFRLQAGSREVREAQAAAVAAAIGYLTAHACVARLGRDGVDRQDGAQLGFLRAEFTHRCSREGDPQLHSHTVLVNVLEAPDGRRAALDGGLLFQHAKAADGIYQAALRAELSRRLGVGWERHDEHWEIAGIPPGLCREWSKRRSQITAALAARGLDPDTASGRAAQTAALATRHAKVQIGDACSLHDRFAREAIVAGHDPGDLLQAALHAGVRRGPPHGPHVTRLLDAMTGPDGGTKQASSFSRRDAVGEL